MPTDVIGSGLAGQVAALALRRQGHEVRIWGQPERSPTRAIALSAPSVAYLTQLCPAVVELGAPIEHIHVSRQGRFGRTLLNAQDHGQANFGRVIGNDELSEALDQALVAERIDEQVDTLTPGWSINQRHSDFVVLAASAPGLMKQAGISYEQPRMSGDLWVAIGTGATPGTAYERFTPSGPLAILPMGQGRASLVWQVAHDVSDIAQINAAIGHRVRLSGIEHQARFPIRLHRAHSLARPGLAVIGNASQFLHPVAGQGFNLILRQIQLMVQHDLATFNTRALADQARWFQTTRALAQVFQPQIPLQGLALLALQAKPWLKSAFVSQFMEGA